MAEQASQTTTIAAAPERVWAIAADVERYPEWAKDVKDVVVDFHGARHAAAVSRDAVTLPVDKHLAKQILDPTAAQLRSLPSHVTVRVFAVSMPAEVRNPPTTATPRTATPVRGRMTFELS